MKRFIACILFIFIWCLMGWTLDVLEVSREWSAYWGFAVGHTFWTFYEYLKEADHDR